MRDQTQVKYEPLEDGDFTLIKEQNQPQSLKEFIVNKCDVESHLIVFCADIDIDVLTENDMLVKEWISGFSDEQCIKTFENAINRRNRISKTDNDMSILIKDGILKLNQYMIDAGFLFYVFDSETRKKIKTNVDIIKKMVESEQNHDKPVCVFLAGAPGTGKSYFVERFIAYLKADDYYPAASLSGVTEGEFPSAVKEHINAVYDKRTNRDNGTHIAFLDEVDTKGGVLAFRLLMDAMTGNSIDSKGIRRDDKTKKLIWIFAGSAGLNREDFIECFYKDDKKVVDFFDRIHFDIVLPTVEQPGQAILAFLSSLPVPKDKDEQGKIRSEIKVAKAVLNLFGRTVWKGARQIKTICRIACSRSIDWDNIQLDNFDGIDTSADFLSSLHAVRSLAEVEGSDLSNMVTIKIL
jgi:GTPase SAR1 family protein